MRWNPSPELRRPIFSARSRFLSLHPLSGRGALWTQSPPLWARRTQSDFGAPRASLPAGALLRQPTERRLINQKQYLEAKRLLKEFRARYRQLVRCSLRSVFRATAPPPGRPALSEAQPRFGRFLEFMDEFCKGPTASDSKS